MSQRKIIAICSSATFYKHVNELADELEKLGFTAVVPLDCRRMKKSGNYDVSAVKTWYKNPKDFHKKAFYIQDHFNEIEKADAILVVNDEKQGYKGYIGSNVIVEMGLAFYLKKPIFVLNPVNETMPTYEEVFGLGSIILGGKLAKIKL